MLKAPYIDKNEFFGNEAYKNISKIIQTGGYKKLLVITGKKSYQISGLKNVLESQLYNVDYITINDFEVNPKYSDILRIGKSLSATKFDLIVAGGGGSVIDFAKGLNVYLSTQQNNGQNGIVNSSLLKAKFLPMVAIPTTAGTGSEATHFAVVYIDKKKVSVAHEALRPKYAIIDPRFCYKSPKYITACCGFDALCQAIESYWSINASIRSKKHAKKAIALITNSIVKATMQDCHKAREELSLGSFLAGKAINISKTTAPHALSYSLTSYFKIPHGHAVALTLGKFFTINESEKLHKDLTKNIDLKVHLENLNEIKKNMGWLNRPNFESEWLNLMKECGLDTEIGELRNSGVSLEDLINSVNEERLSNHPIKITKKIISEIYSQLLA